jgi:hypothetical protein
LEEGPDADPAQWQSAAAQDFPVFLQVGGGGLRRTMPEAQRGHKR